MATSNYGNGASATVLGGWTVVDKTSSDPTWSIPSDAKFLNVLIIGGGGGGGSGAFDESSVTTTEAQGGGGGGGGAALFIKNLNPAFLRKYGITIPIVVGAGGSGGVNIASTGGLDGVAGTSGTASSFGPFSASGGSGGAGGIRSGSTQITAAPGGSAGSVTGSRMLLASPTTIAQLSDILNMSSISTMALEYISITGGSGAASAALNFATTNTILNSISATAPTSSTFSVASFSWSSIFNAGATGGGTFVSRTSTAGAGSSAGFCGGGGAGGNAYQNDTNSPSNALYALSFPTAGVFGGGGGAGGIEQSQSGQGAGGAGAANSGGGGGGGGGSDTATRDGTTVPTNNGGAGGSGRVIIWYRT